MVNLIRSFFQPIILKVRPEVRHLLPTDLIIVFRRSAEGATLAFDALPSVLADRDQHVVRELQTSRVT
jgi:hypothetical protein